MSCQNWFIGWNFDQFATSTIFGLFYQRNRASKKDAKIKSDHSETIFNRYFMPKLICWKFDKFSIFLVSGLFFINRSDHQECRPKSSRVILKAFLIYFSFQNWFATWKFEQFTTSLIFGLFFINGTDHQQWRSKSSRIILKPFPIDFSWQRWLIGWKFNQFATFLIFESIFHAKFG